MFPIGDDRVEGGAPALVVLGLIALNVLMFIIELNQPSDRALQAFIQAWGVVPREYVNAQDLPPTIPLPFWATLFSSMFLHGGWMHLAGNMLYLWIFGDNLEKVMGAGRFAFFYFACGILGFWILIQMMNGIGSMATTSETGGGVAYMAHIGGFIAGVVMVRMMANPRRALA